jgi:hypothetical protein
MEYKTALQQAFSDLEEMQPHLFNVFSQEGRDFVYHFHKYLEIEKEQIINAYKNGYNNAYFNNPKTAEEYFKETFGNEKK